MCNRARGSCFCLPLQQKRNDCKETEGETVKAQPAYECKTCKQYEEFRKIEVENRELEREYINALIDERRLINKLLRHIRNQHLLTVIGFLICWTFFTAGLVHFFQESCGK